MSGFTLCTYRSGFAASGRVPGAVLDSLNVTGWIFPLGKLDIWYWIDLRPPVPSNRFPGGSRQTETGVAGGQLVRTCLLFGEVGWLRRPVVRGGSCSSRSPQVVLATRGRGVRISSLSVLGRLRLTRTGPGEPNATWSSLVCKSWLVLAVLGSRSVRPYGWVSLVGASH